MQKQPNSPLLPIGFYDLLFDEAEKNHKNINLALDIFFEAGYRLIKTPLLEFSDNFQNHEIENSFEAVDVISGKNLIFRNDITLQIARLLATRFKQEKLPLKLCYVGDVLCAKSEELYADRQQTQVGVEIIGCDEEKSNFEIIKILLSVLKKLEAKKLLIEFSLPDFLEIFLSEIGANNQEELLKAVRKKNISLVKNLDEKNGEIISKIALLNDNLPGLVEEVSAQTKSEELALELQKAQKILRFMKAEFEEVEVRFDLFGDHETSYHHDISFDVFCDDFSYPIARGGKYKINDSSKSLDAVGATIYMNRLRKIV